MEKLKIEPIENDPFDAPRPQSMQCYPRAITDISAVGFRDAEGVQGFDRCLRDENARVEIGWFTEEELQQRRYMYPPPRP